LLVAGVWTPVAAIVIVLLQLGLALAADVTIAPALERAAFALCLALLGPGAWSIDARLFGRRRVEIKNLRDD
jgi:putative oxidoreductase